MIAFAIPKNRVINEPITPAANSSIGASISINRSKPSLSCLNIPSPAPPIIAANAPKTNRATINILPIFLRKSVMPFSILPTPAIMPFFFFSTGLSLLGFASSCSLVSFKASPKSFLSSPGPPGLTTSTFTASSLSASGSSNILSAGPAFMPSAIRSSIL